MYASNQRFRAFRFFRVLFKSAQLRSHGLALKKPEFGKWNQGKVRGSRCWLPGRSLFSILPSMTIGALAGTAPSEDCPQPGTLTLCSDCDLSSTA